MFQSSPTNTQQSLFSSMINFLPEAKQRQLNNPKAWQNIFYEQITRKIPEEEFQPLFSDTGRPNASLRILVAMMILKEGYGWSDNELFDTCSFNLLIRQALGLNNIVGQVGC